MADRLTPGDTRDKHPGFKGAAASIMARGKSKKSAYKILAAGARGASPAAKDANPRLRRVSGA